MKILKRIEKFTKNNNKVYIIPTKAGFKYIFINFTLFLISLSYTNNLCLLITFTMVAYFILQMLDTHKIIQDLEIKSITINDHYLNQSMIICQLNSSQNTSLSSFVNFEFVMRNKSYLATEVEELTKNLITKKIKIKKRGHYKFDRIKIYTTGVTRMFYVWKYYQSNFDFYTYPRRLNLSQGHYVNDTDKKQGVFESEFHSHHPYIFGMPSKRIDWKIYARSDQLYWKKHIDFHNRAFEINFNKIDANNVEEKISAMAHLIQKHYKNGHSWKLVLPNSVIPSGKGNEHFKNSMEKISVY